MLENDPFVLTAPNGPRLMHFAWALSMAVVLSASLRGHARFVRLRGPEAKPFLRVFHPPALNSAVFLASGVTLVGLLIASVLIGEFAPLLLGFAVIAYVFYFSQIGELAEVRRKTNLFIPVSVALIASGSLSQPFVAASPAWPLFLIKLFIVQMYFSSGIEKLRRGWCREVLRAYLLRQHLRLENSRGLWLAGRRGLCGVIAVAILGFELLSPLVLFLPGIDWIFGCAAFGFHVGTTVFMRIHYLKFHGPALLVFFVEPVYHATSNYLIPMFQYP